MQGEQSPATESPRSDRSRIKQAVVAVMEIGVRNSIKNKPLGMMLSLAATVLLVVLMAIVFFQMQQATLHMEAAAEQRFRSYQLADELRQSSDDLTRLGRTYVVTGDSSYEQQYNAILDIRNGKAPRPEEYGRVYWDFVAGGQPKPRPDTAPVALNDLMTQAGFTAEEFALLAEAQARSDGLVNLEVEAMNAVKGLYKDSSGQYTRRGEPDWELARSLVHGREYHVEKAKIMEPVDQFYVMLDQRTKAAQDSAHVELDRAQEIFVALLVAMLASVALTVWFGYRQLLQTLGGKPAVLEGLVTELAAGNLAIKVPAAPQGSAIGRVGEMAMQLRTLTVSLNEAVAKVDSAAKELTQNVRQSVEVASANSQSASSMAAAAEEMSVNISRLAGTAKDGMEVAEESGRLSNQGGEIIERSAAEIQAISQMVEKVSARIGELGQNSERISSVVQVIREVADQTNLLALNAAIEAARAGEMGRGFAVVADEVRKLAERTSAATGEISTMVSSIQTNANGAVEAMDQAVSRVTAGVEYSSQAADAIADIREGAARSARLASDISNALSEQGNASHTIAAEVERVAANTENARKASEQAAHSAGVLAQLAESMRTMAGAFRV